MAVVEVEAVVQVVEAARAGEVVMADLAVEVVQVGPRDWHAPPAMRFRASEDMGELRDADVIITDCWPAGAEPAALLRWQVTEAVLEAGRAVFLPCPPVTRGQEVSAGAMLHPRCRVVEAKAWLLHAQNAVLEWCLA